MKNPFLAIVVLSSALLALTFSGCSSLTKSTDVANEIQNVLTNILPPDFQGDISFGPNNPYFDIAVSVYGIHKVGDKWTWTGLDYERHDMWNTSFKVKMSPKPFVAVPAN